MRPCNLVDIYQWFI